ncbi:isochorismatase family protein, partial [Erwinia sp.]|uniref:isochorismatase family protein n=1 Tax=Erwinia citreus TaxID=558 RepID=UPI002896657A
MLELNAATTALVLIDLQEGILPFAGGPYKAEDVVSRSAKLAEKFRAVNAPVVLVRVGWAKDFGDAPKQPVDNSHGGLLPDNWWDWPPALGKQESD